MSSSSARPTAEWRFTQFGLIVTGKTEEKCLPDLFRVIAATGMCSFRVLRKVDQRSPRSDKHQLRMVGRGKKIPDKDETDIGLPARRYLAADDRFLLLVDDLEADRIDSIQGIFDRYRLALDTFLTEGQSRRAAVHFLANMLEAYYFADSRAVNSVLSTTLDDYEGDVETIRNPKSRMRKLCPRFDVVEDGCRIVGSLLVIHVLSREDTCSTLRTMFAWIYKAIGEPECELRQVLVGGYNDVTRGQICLLSR